MWIFNFHSTLALRKYPQHRNGIMPASGSAGFFVVCWVCSEGFTTCISSHFIKQPLSCLRTSVMKVRPRAEGSKPFHWCLQPSKRVELYRFWDVWIRYWDAWHGYVLSDCSIHRTLFGQQVWLDRLELKIASCWVRVFLAWFDNCNDLMLMCSTPRSCATNLHVRAFTQLVPTISPLRCALIF